MSTINFDHDPDAVRTYAVYWGNNMAAGDTLATVAWDVPAGITMVSEGINAAAVTENGITYAIGTCALVRLSAATAGTVYDLTCHITTTAGDEDDQSVTITCAEH